MKIGFSILLFFFSSASLSQENEIDSLLATLHKAEKDTTEVNILNTLAEKYWQSSDYANALNFALEARMLSHQIKFQSGEGRAFINSSLVYWKQGDYPKAIELAFQGLHLFEAARNRPGIARAHNCLGLIYFNQKNFEEALIEYSKGLSIRNEIGDTTAIAGSLNNIGEVYKEQGDLDLALVYFEKALEINEKYKNENWAAININNIGTIYTLKAEKYEIETDDQIANLKIALGHYLKALKIREKIQDKQGIAQSYLSIGEVNMRLKNYDKARTSFENALHYSTGIGYLEAMKSSHQDLEYLGSTLGNWQDAYLHQKLFRLYSDSLINEENTRKSIHAVMNFSFEKRENILKEAQKEEQRKQQLILISVTAGLIFALIIAFVILRSLRRNQKQNRIIIAQKEIVVKQKQLVEEKQKEISDSINYAERIQRSFMATTELLSNNLPSYFVFFQPKDVVSGDFYWAHQFENGSFLLATADSTGHGVPGAIMSILNISCLENAVEEKGLNAPAEILNHAREKIIQRLKKDGSPEGGKDGMDCSLIRFDLEKAELTYSAANNPIWIVRQNELIALVADRMPVGKGDKDEISFTQHVVSLQKNDVIYTLTDGLPDQFGGPRGKKFLYKKLKELLLSIAEEPLANQEERLKAEFLNWKGNLEQVDDICIIGIRV